MTQFSTFDPVVQMCLQEIEAVADRYLREGLDTSLILAALAAVAIKTAQADPPSKRINLDYFADVVRRAGDTPIVEK